MKWRKYNPNPMGRMVGDCVIRAISKAMNCRWEDAYIEIALQGYLMCDMPSSNAVWGAYLRGKGFTRHTIPEDKMEGYTVDQFCTDHPSGVYVVALGSHVVAVVDGCIYDTWESGNEIPIYYFEKEKSEG